MQRALLTILLVSLVVEGRTAPADTPKQPVSLPISKFAEALGSGQRILEEPGWMNWCMAPIYDDQSKLHLYYCRWTAENRSAWLESAQIIHATAPKPEGPYTKKSVVLGDNKNSYFNPQITRTGDTYVLVYAYISRLEKNKLRQQVGIATAKSADGPWIQSPYNPVIVPGISGENVDLLHASNPTFVQAPDGQYRIYFKSIFNDQTPPMLRTISLACSENVDGPYQLHSDNPLISYVDKRVDIEDPYVFYYKNQYYLIVEDRMNVAEAVLYDRIPADRTPGGWRPGLIYSSKDGHCWEKPKIGYRQNSFYFDEKIRRFERPHILWKNGRPQYLFLALDGGKYEASSGAILKISDW